MAADLEKLQGAWRIEALEMDGQEMPAENLAGARIVVNGFRFHTEGMGADYGGVLVLKDAGKLRHLDMKFETGPETGNTNLGIYEIKDDRWRICLATRGRVRPKTFASKPGSGIALETLVKHHPQKTEKANPVEAPEPVPSTTPTELEGDWSMLSGIVNGAPMEASMLQWVTRSTRGNIAKVTAGPQTMVHVQFTHDPTAGTIDYTNLSGSAKGKKQLGVYKLEGDVLTVSMAAAGAPRPTGFSAVKGDGRTVTVWKRR